MIRGKDSGKFVPGFGNGATAIPDAAGNLVIRTPGAATELPTVSRTPVTEDAALSSVTAQRLNVREGPGTNFAIATTARQGDELPVLGRNADCSWLNVRTDAGVGWVSAGYVSLDADCAAFPDTTPQPYPGSL